MPSIPQPLYALVGPTASGKTAVGVELAKLLAAEVISLDSMQLYRGLPILTAQPSAAERAAVPHHLLACLAPTEGLDLKRYLALADAARAQIAARGARALFVGGTPLYLKGLIHGTFEGPSADWGLSSELERQEAAEPGSLYRRLRALDPQAPDHIHPANIRRIVRALEVLERGGRSIGELQTQWRSMPEGPAPVLLGLRRERAELHRRIAERVDAMWAAGVVEEVRALAAAEVSRQLAQAVGWPELIEHIAGRLSQGQARERIVQRTRQLVRKQDTWLRHFPVRWFEVSADRDDPAELARRMAAVCEAPAG